jgi:hypothetical protein
MSKSPESLSTDRPTPREGSPMAEFVESVEAGDPNLRVVVESAAKAETVDAGADTVAFNPYSVLGEFIASLPEGDREAAAEYITGTIVEPAGEVALAGADVEVVPAVVSIDSLDAPVPVAVEAEPAAEPRTSFVTEADIDTAPKPTLAPVIEIRPGASTEAPVVNKPTIDERVAVAKKLKDTAPGGVLSFSEKRILNKTSRDARTAERRRIKKGDAEMAEVKKVHEGYQLQEIKSNELQVASDKRKRSARKLEVANQLRAKEDKARADATVDGVFNDRAYRARMKTYEKQLKRAVDASTKRDIAQAEANLSQAGRQLSTAEKSRKEAIKSRRWYKNTRFSKSNRAKHGARGVTTYAARSTSLRSIGSTRVESDDERRRRLEREAA